ncbi:MAG: ABC transporter substrate-binding protein [Bacilli bacterium]
MKKSKLLLLFISSCLLLSCAKSSNDDEYENKEGWFVEQNNISESDGLDDYFNMPLNPSNANYQCLSSFESDKVYKVTLWTTMSDPLKGIITSKLKDGKYLPSYPNIEIQFVKYSSYTDLKDAIVNALVAGTYPSLSFCLKDDVAIYNKSQKVVHLDSFIEDENYGLKQDNFIAPFFNEGRTYGDEHLYCLPFAKESDVLYYNKTFFEENNLKVPSTWDEMWSVCKEIKEIDDASIPLGIETESNLFINLTKSYGYSYLSSGKKFGFDNDGSKSIVKSLENMYQEGYLLTQASIGNDASIMMDKNSTHRSYMTIAPNSSSSYLFYSDFETGVTKIPSSPEGITSIYFNGPSLCMFNKDDEQNMAAWLAMQFLLSDEVQTSYAIASSSMPTTFSSINSSIYIDYLGKKEENTRDGVISKASKQAIEQIHYYETSPSFIGSQKAYIEVGEIIKSVLYLDKQVDATFKAAIKECQYAAS